MTSKSTRREGHFLGTPHKRHWFDPKLSWSKPTDVQTLVESWRDIKIKTSHFKARSKDPQEHCMEVSFASPHWRLGGFLFANAPGLRRCLSGFTENEVGEINTWSCCQ